MSPVAPNDFTQLHLSIGGSLRTKSTGHDGPMSERDSRRIQLSASIGSASVAAGLGRGHLTALSAFGCVS